MAVLSMISSVLGLGAQLRSLLVGRSRLALEAKSLGFGLSLGRCGVRGEPLGLVDACVRDRVGPLLGGVASRGLLDLRLSLGEGPLALVLLVHDGLLLLGRGAGLGLLGQCLAAGFVDLLGRLRLLGVGDGLVGDRSL